MDDIWILMTNLTPASESKGLTAESTKVDLKLCFEYLLHWFEPYLITCGHSHLSENSLFHFIYWVQIFQLVFSHEGSQSSFYWNHNNALLKYKTKYTDLSSSLSNSQEAWWNKNTFMEILWSLSNCITSKISISFCDHRIPRALLATLVHYNYL